MIDRRLIAATAGACTRPTIRGSLLAVAKTSSREATAHRRGADRRDRPHRRRAAGASRGRRRARGARGEPAATHRGAAPAVAALDRALSARRRIWVALTLPTKGV